MITTGPSAKLTLREPVRSPGSPVPPDSFDRGKIGPLPAVLIITGNPSKPFYRTQTVTVAGLDFPLTVSMIGGFPLTPFGTRTFTCIAPFTRLGAAPE